MNALSVVYSCMFVRNYAKASNTGRRRCDECPENARSAVRDRYPETTFPIPTDTQDVSGMRTSRRFVSTITARSERPTCVQDASVPVKLPERSKSQRDPVPEGAGFFLFKKNIFSIKKLILSSFFEMYSISSQKFPNFVAQKVTLQSEINSLCIYRHLR